ncbi:hypothetical protein [Geobacter sp. DSM 9736]|uniref:hypothetical protein n=1 Tax=Geobacter sp. DSM 9736 TaxID=1277350 RepID=UPI000B501B22|nr:hypothetical protein [Geobacter sp. DSM 9736]SNB46995.1 hypothetical protein SAMN06269301_2469 [Geobacter sp. DSM 9736]
MDYGIGKIGGVWKVHREQGSPDRDRKKGRNFRRGQKEDKVTISAEARERIASVAPEGSQSEKNP